MSTFSDFIGNTMLPDYHEAIRGKTEEYKKSGSSQEEAEFRAIDFFKGEMSKLGDYFITAEDLDRQDNARAINQADRIRREKAILSQTPAQRFGNAFEEAITEGSADHRKAFWHAREMRGLDDEAPRISQILGINPTVTRLREAMGFAKPEDVEAREKAGLGLKKDGYARAGQLLGTLGADVIQDRSRNLYWLLNAPQAVANVLQEKSLARAVPELYQSSQVVDKKGNPVELKPENYKFLVENDYIGLNEDGNEILRGGVNRVSRGGKTFLTKRNYRPGAVDALAIPTGIAINAGVGLLNPLGGGNGYSAVFESKDDPTKTSNVVGEIAAKYILGRTGNLLSWDEFKKVRPDVSKDEYMRYKAFKYDKDADFDITDGDFTLPTGIIKGTMDGIHGPEIQMLGRSLPIATAILPTIAAGIGTTMGAKWEPKDFKEYREARDVSRKVRSEEEKRIKQTTSNEENRREMRNIANNEINTALDMDFKSMPQEKQDRFRRINRVRNGLVGGLGAYAGSLAIGLGIENERRRRNQAENERQQNQL